MYDLMLFDVLLVCDTDSTFPFAMHKADPKLITEKVVADTLATINKMRYSGGSFAPPVYSAGVYSAASVYNNKDNTNNYPSATQQAWQLPGKSAQVADNYDAPAAVHGRPHAIAGGSSYGMSFFLPGEIVYFAFHARSAMNMICIAKVSQS